MEAMRMPIGKDFLYGCLRSLSTEDVADMLLWMHDPKTIRHFMRDFASVTEKDAIQFVRSSWCSTTDMHLAVCGKDGAYLGTVSLKDVDVVAGTAEYAIAMAVGARGTGAAMAGTRDLLAIAFDGLGLGKVWLCVRDSNARAIGFYSKVGFVPQNGRKSATDLRFFGMSKYEFERLRKSDGRWASEECAWANTSSQ